MPRYSIQRTQWTIVAIGLLALLLSRSHRLTESRAWQKVEGELIDSRFEWRGERPADTNIAIVGVKASSFVLDTMSPEEIQASQPLQLMLQPFPWDRRVFAAVLDKLANAGAKVVVFDFVFSASKENDDAFAAALARSKDRVVLGGMFQYRQQDVNDESGDQVKYIDDSKYILPNETLLTPIREAGGVGFVNIWWDADGTVRRGRYVTSIERESPQLRKLAGTVFPDNMLHIDALAVRKFAGSVSTPPYDHDNLIDFHGGPLTYPVLPVEEMFASRTWASKAFASGAVFKDKIVIVGPYAEILKDRHDTPFGELSGPEIQAQMIATLLRGSSLRDTSRATGVGLSLVMVLLALLICFRVTNALLKVLFLAAVVGIFFVLCQLAFVKAGLVVAMAPALFCLALTGTGGVVLEYAFEQIERRRYRNVLDRYVSKNVAETILQDRRRFEDALSGQKQSVTILFSDIRGFTSMSEGRDAQELVAQLNEYFLEMVGVVLREGGTLQKFIGDAIMAAWGDTLTKGPAEDARRGVRAALQMRAALAQLNARWQGQPGRTPLNIGVGVNHGEIIVGNIGHPQRMEFTVMGDGVNVASRLENATKQFHADILVGPTVAALTREHFIFRQVGLITVKGKTHPVEVFEVLGESGDRVPAWLAGYHEAIRLYRAREFGPAEAAFRRAAAEIGRPDFLCETYIRCCETCLAMPPPPAWDGSFTLTEK